MDAARAKYEAETMDGPYTLAQLRAAFDRVQDPANWKNPINAELGAVSAEDRRLISHAVTFYTGSVVEWRSSRGGRDWRCTAAGYYLTVGA